MVVNIQRQPGANVIEVVDRVKALLPQLESSLPAAIQVTVLTDRTNTIRASVRDVNFELVLAVVLVVLVIFLFLGSLRATVIPTLAGHLPLCRTCGRRPPARLPLTDPCIPSRPASWSTTRRHDENITRYKSRASAAAPKVGPDGFTIVSSPPAHAC